MTEIKFQGKAWLISVSMGYGHQRTAYPLKEITPEGKIINANDYPGIPLKDKKTWESSQNFYEFISNIYRLPLFGKLAFSLFDYFQRILTFYPRRDLSKPDFVLKKLYALIKAGWGRDLIEKLKLRNQKLGVDLPLVSTFFTPAFMAEVHNYPGEIFCIVCDSDVSRTWAPLYSFKSRIKYFVPTERVVDRLLLYGVRKENIFCTGYPLPLENIGDERMEILKEDLKYRLINLDPQKKYFKNYQTLIETQLGDLPLRSSHPLTLMFSIGGAGAQKEIAIQIIKSLREKIKKGEIRIFVGVGVKEKVKQYIKENLKKLNLEDWEYLQLISGDDIFDYFEKFNRVLRETDILWTKPSELSFYTALGLPIILAPTIGSQEEYNRDWLLKIGSAIIQENPHYTEEWLFDYLKEGWFADAAMQGFIEGEKFGVLKIKKILQQCSG